jgi:CDP-diacylglycerol---glycerol-3-phosphate 3-phosphatidyltransferase
MFDGRWRGAVDRSTGPVGRKLQRIGVTADMLTATGLISATATAVAVGTGHLHLAIVLLILTGLHDLLDGPVAKASGTSSVRGAFFDSVTDRVSDVLILGGVAWYLETTHPGHLVLLPFAVLGATSLVSYQRAKAESLGISAKGGLMERAERMILLGIGFLSPSFLVPVLWVMLGLTMATAVGRFVKVWRLAEAPVPADSPRRQRRARTEARAGTRRSSSTPSRWRARRQGELASRSGRTWRARQARQGLRQRTGRRHT